MDRLRKAMPRLLAPANEARPGNGKDQALDSPGSDDLQRKHSTKAHSQMCVPAAGLTSSAALHMHPLSKLPCQGAVAACDLIDDTDVLVLAL